MNRIVLIICVCIIFIAGNDTGLKFKENPPGTIYVHDSLFIDIQPVRVKDYIEFLTAIKQYYSIQFKDSVDKLPLFGLDYEVFRKLNALIPKDSIFYKRMIPRVLMTHGNDKKSWDVDYMLTNPVYANYPVVNITFEQASEYCKWRTTMVKLGYAIQCKNEKSRRKYPMNFIYKLPSRKDWQDALGVFFQNAQSSKFKKDPNKPANLVVQYNIKSKNKFYYDATNVAELLDNRIVTSDFVWTGGIGNISFSAYDTPKDWLGFRCVCQILIEKQANTSTNLIVNNQKTN